MSRALLDVNVLLALFDLDHVDHHRARAWLEGQAASGWASCPITQNGFVRIVAQPRYPNPITPDEAVGLLAGACADPHHEGWPCDVSITDRSAIDPTRLHGPRQITDAYLLALAARHGGRFVTFDRSVALSAVPCASADDLVVI